MTNVIAFILAVISTVILFLLGITAIEDTVDVRWGWIGLAFLAAAVAIASLPIAYISARRAPPV